MSFYKKLIKNQGLRFKILDFLEFVPDKTMIRLQYHLKTGNKLDLNTPKRYTEKIQWYKLNYRDSNITICSDKYTVRSFVKERGMEEYLNELYAVYDSVDDIDFETLPNSFAIKMTTGSGTNLFISDKTKMDEESVKRKLYEWINRSKKSYGREWGYYDSKRRIIIEKLIERDKYNDIPDYKFFCFDGKVNCLYTMIDYTDNHEEGKLGFFDKDFNQLPFRRNDFGEIDRQIPRPLNFEKMIEVAEILSKGFPHVRVDFYNIEGKIIFGEMTFYNASGYTKFVPDEYDFILGENFKLPKSIKESRESLN